MFKELRRNKFLISFFLALLVALVFCASIAVLIGNSMAPAPDCCLSFDEHDNWIRPSFYETYKELLIGGIFIFIFIFALPVVLFIKKKFRLGLSYLVSILGWTLLFSLILYLIHLIT